MGCHTWEYHNPQPVEWLPDTDCDDYISYIKDWYADQEELEKALSQTRTWFGCEVTAEEMLRWLYLSDAYDDGCVLSADCTQVYTRCKTVSANFRIIGYPYFILHNHKQAVEELRNYCGQGYSISWYCPKYQPQKGVTLAKDDDYVIITQDSPDSVWYKFEKYLYSLWEKEPDLVIAFG